ncbi:MAG: translesion error-prone DNA polymerase V autoproteolytic subunit [Cyanobacteria bacterium J06633_2]
MFLVTVPAGFPSPADDYLEGNLDLNRHLIHHPAATFFVRVRGDSMVGAGIHSGDLLIVDRAVKATHNSIVIAVVNGDVTVKRYCLESCRDRKQRISLVPDNPEYPTIHIDEAMDFEVWGVVIGAYHFLHQQP